MASLLAKPIPCLGSGLPASVRAAVPAIDLSQLLLILIVLTALVALLAQGLSLEEAVAVISAGSMLVAELRQRLA